jgi:hypothetical protein
MSMSVTERAPPRAAWREKPPEKLKALRTSAPVVKPAKRRRFS